MQYYCTQISYHAINYHGNSNTKLTQKVKLHNLLSFLSVIQLLLEINQIQAGSPMNKLLLK